MDSPIVFLGDTVRVYHPDDDETPWVGVQAVHLYEDRAVLIITLSRTTPLSPSNPPRQTERKPSETALLRIVNVITSEEWKLPYTLRFE